MRAALTPDLLATDLAEYLVRKGVSFWLPCVLFPTLSDERAVVQMPFRQTHHISGSCVRMAEELKVPLSDLTPQQLQSVSSSFGDDVASEVFDFEKSVERRDVFGGPAKARVLEQVQVMKQQLGAA